MAYFYFVGHSNAQNRRDYRLANHSTRDDAKRMGAAIHLCRDSEYRDSC